MSASSNVFVIDLVVRMVVPMRREFGLSLDVQQFMRDAGYATEVLAKALNSHVPRLREYADQVRRELTGLAARERQTGVTAYDQYVRTRKMGARVAADGVSGVAAGPSAPGAASAAPRPSPAFLSQRLEAGQLIAHLRGQRAAAGYVERCAPAPRA